MHDRSRSRGAKLAGNTGETTLPTWASHYEWSHGYGHAGWSDRR